MTKIKKYCFYCLFNNIKPKGIFKKIYYWIWLRVNLPLGPSKVSMELGKYLINDFEKGFKEGLKKGGK